MPNSVYTQLDSKGENAVQNTVYDENGNAVYQVDFKQHGKDFPSGHGHELLIPGKIESGHIVDHIKPKDVPSTFKLIPKGTKYSQPIEK